MERSLQHAFDAEEVMAYLDGELEPQRAAMLASHLEHCAECQETATNVRRVSKQVLSFEIEAAPRALHDTIVSAMNARDFKQDSDQFPPHTKENWKKVSWNWKKFVLNPYGIAFALLVTIAFLLNQKAGVNQRHYQASSTFITIPPVEKGSDIAESERDRTGLYSQNLVSPAPGVVNGPIPPPPPRTPPNARVQAPETTGPMIVQTAKISVVAKNYDEASAAIEKLAIARGGYLEKLESQSRINDARRLSAAMRIPTTQMGAFLADVRKLGHVEEESQSNEEVSAEYVDLQARLRSAQATERRLIELLGTRTGRLEDVLDAERELARVREEIESMQGQSALLVHRVSYATVQVQLSEEYHEKLQSSGPTGTKLRNALVEGLQNLQDGVVGLLIFLLNYGLSILFWLAIVPVPVWLVWKRWHVRRGQETGVPFQRT
jgi:hypothetical protein